ncbi:MAG: S9 family peptidase [Paraprevotella sp.]|nr:S9 family peptidase [Paraprevotella sp.]
MTVALGLYSALPAAAADDAPIIGKNQITLTGDRLTPETLWAMGRIGSYAVSPDAKKIVYTVSYYSVQQNKSHTVLYLMNADGSGNTLLTTTADNESDPAFTPDGKSITFLSGKSGSSQIWQMTLEDNVRRQLSFCHKDVEGYKFSPDGKKVIFIQSVDTYASIEKKYDDLPLASGMVINDLNYKHWDHYVTTIPHIFLAELKNGKIQEGVDLLNGEPYECPMLPFGGSEQFNWSPDSRYIVYTCRKKTEREYAISTDSDIYCYDIQTGKTSNLCKPADYKEPATDPTQSMAQQPVNHQSQDYNVGYDMNPAYSPDGKYVAWLSMARDGYESDRIRLCVLNLKEGTKTYVTESFESGVDGFCWQADSRSFYFSGVWHARSMIYSTNLKGEVHPLTTGDFDYGSSLSLCGQSLIATRHSLSEPDDIYSLSFKKKKETEVSRLTRENRYFQEHLTMGEVKERWVETSDGKKELCWVVYPPHFDASTKYPALLYCEGGPQSPVSQFWSYRWNLQIMAANDYIIVAPNRRGLPGFGMEWLEEISGDYSGRCMQDYLDAIDDICKEPYVDKDRLGCVGASFGGYSVYYLAGHHNKRFKSFIAHDGIFNTQQQYYETEEMWFPNWDLGAAPWRKGISEQPDTAAQVKDAQPCNPYATSPHLAVDKWDTPILCIHGEKDYRILSSQGQSAFDAAIMRGIPAELLLYPDENHWVLKPQNGILWQRTFFRWLDRWLKK